MASGGLPLRRIFILLTGLGLLVVSILIVDAPSQLEVAATNSQFKMLATENSPSDATFDAFVPAAISTPTQTVGHAAEPQPTSPVMLLSEPAVATNTATHTAATVRAGPSSPWLDRLARNKPSVWENKGFYVVLGILYLTLLCLFLKQIINSCKH